MRDRMPGKPLASVAGWPPIVQESEMARKKSWRAFVCATALANLASCALPPDSDVPPPDSDVPAPARPDALCADRDHAEVPRYDFEPSLESPPQPIYPDEAAAAKEQGTVLCHVLIDATGRITEVHVLQSATPRLDAAAVQACRTAIFKPALRKDGTTIATWMVIPVEFQLNNVLPGTETQP